MSDSIIILDDSVNEDRISSSTENTNPKSQKFAWDNDEDDDNFVVPLPDFDHEINFDEPAMEPVISQPSKKTKLTKKSSAKDIEKAAKAERRAELAALKAAQKREQQEIAEKKKNERMEKRLAKEAERILKKEQRDSTRAQKPTSMIKGITIIMDNRILKLGKADIFTTAIQQNLLNADDPVAVDLVDAVIPYSITWKLRNPYDSNGSIISSDEMVIALPVIEFVNLCHVSLIGDSHSNVQAYFKNIQGKTRQRLILIIVGYDEYLKNYKAFTNRQHRQQCGDSSGNSGTMKGLKTFDRLQAIVNPEDIDRILVNLQMALNVTYMTTADLDELAVLVQHFTKAVAEKPEKTRKLSKNASFNWQEFGFAKGIKIDDDGTGRRELWRRIVMQCLPRQDVNFSAAIVEKYKNPRELLEAYNCCDNIELARNLLTSVDESGPRRNKASRRIHMAFTCPNSKAVINLDSNESI